MKSEIITRNDYLEKIIPYIDTPFVKIFTGIRHCGKSSILKMIIEKIKKNMFIQDEQIISCNFDSLYYIDMSEKQLFEFLYSRLSKTNKNYLFLEEIQTIKGWEKALNQVVNNFDVDIYISSSQDYSENNNFSGFIKFDIFTLSFKEYLLSRSDFEAINDPKNNFDNYLDNGGFPSICLKDLSGEEANSVVKDIYNSVLYSDIIRNGQVRKADLLERIVKFIFYNVGKNVSAKGISDYLKSENRTVDNETVYSYLEKLQKANLIYRCARYDLKNDEVLKTQEKYYLADVSFIKSVLGIADNDNINLASMENIVYLELRRRGYDVYEGKINSNKICFVAFKENEKIYIDFFEKNISEKDKNKKIKLLLGIEDNYPKYILSTDLYNNSNNNGIKIMHVADFLLSENYSM